ncbi:MAG: chloride channel protein [Ignavibacteria bacterium]|nr:chloride channel protein [Ignavibacteria bacterium]MCU7504902.1 chloride channel protein [Ignavibacteria bacterium]MCU7517806.1 chloride channel protein [Ignavibacteria bacterium]
MNLYIEIILKLKKILSPRQFLIFSSVLVGVTAGLFSVLLKTVVHFIHHILTYDYGFRMQEYLYLIFPVFGIVLTVAYINIFLKGRFGRGAAHILNSIARKSGLVERVTMFSHMITSALTVGLGGSAGLEAPIVVTGSAIGSNYSRVNQMDYKERILLIGCGAAAGIAAVFNAPIAGMMFALEVLIPEITISSFVPLIISAATGALCSKIILQEKILFTFSLRQPFDYTNIPYYVVLGLLAGLVSLYYAKAFYKIESLFRPLESRNYLKAVLGGLALAVLIFLFPPLLGEGYSSILLLAEGHTAQLFERSLFFPFRQSEWFVAAFIGAIAIIKVLATGLTLGSGGNGGNFAPSLFVGAFLGSFFSRVVNLTGFTHLPESNFTIVGMAGIMSGVMYAPLTGIFLIAEATGGYELMIPLMIVSALTYAIVKHFEPFSMDTRELARFGLLHNRDRNILTLMHTSEMIETDFAKVGAKASIMELLHIIAHSKRNLFPVVDDNNNLIGIIPLESIRELLFELENYKEIPAIDLMSQPEATVELTEEMSSVMKKFDETGSWNLPVVNMGKYVGFVSKSSIFTKYRDSIIKSNVES